MLMAGAAFASVNLIWVSGATSSPALGSCAMTVPAGRLLSSSVNVGSLNPAARAS